MHRLSVSAAVVSAVLLVPAMSATGHAQPAGTGRTQVWTESTYTSVFQDSGPSADSGRSVDLDSGRNDYEAGQIVLRRDNQS